MLPVQCPIGNVQLKPEDYIAKCANVLSVRSQRRIHFQRGDFSFVFSNGQTPRGEMRLKQIPSRPFPGIGDLDRGPRGEHFSPMAAPPTGTAGGVCGSD